jgi:hypothetical protein
MCPGQPDRAGLRRMFRPSPPDLTNVPINVRNANGRAGILSTIVLKFRGELLRNNVYSKTLLSPYG